MVQLLDTTLRDGSYVVDFQLTAQDTAVIAGALDANNVPFIEVGHGIGMNASANSRTRAACSDEEYLKAAAGAVRTGKWGMFFIPGIGRMEDLDLAASYGMSFVRIGTNVTEVAHAAPYIAHAKRLGMFVSANFMKTYAASHTAVGQLARRAADDGADIVCIVDSAGGMFPEDVTAYFEAAREKTDVPLGFHGHNNMGLAIANTLRAVELGAAIVDTSLRGMGRSAGNANTEIFLLALLRRGMDLGIDPLRVMRIAEECIDPMIRNYPQVDSIGIISGYAQFHSSFLGTVQDHASQYGVDPRELILRVAQEDKVNAPAELVDRLARELAARPVMPRRVRVSAGSGSDRTTDDTITARAVRAATDASTLARKLGKTAVFNLVQAFRPGTTTTVSSTIVDGPAYVTASAEVVSSGDAVAVAGAVDGIVSSILLDCDDKSRESRTIIDAIRSAVTRSTILPYSDLDAWARSVVGLTMQLMAAKSGIVVLVGGNELSAECMARFRRLGVPCRVTTATAGSVAAGEWRQAVAVIFCERVSAEAMTLPAVEHARDTIVIDALIGALPPEVLQRYLESETPVYRPDMRAVIHGEVSSGTGMAALVAESQGLADIEGVTVAAGGRLAPRGTVIVDSARAPRRALGVADGRGFLLAASDLDEELRDRLEMVRAELLSRVAS